MRRNQTALLVLLLFTLVLSGCMSIAGVGTETETFSVTVEVQSDTGSAVPGVTVYEGDSVIGVTNSPGVLEVRGLTRSTTYQVEKLNWTFNPDSQPIRATSSTVTFTGVEATDTYSAVIRVQDVDRNPVPNVSIARGGFTLGATDDTGTFTISGLVDPEVVFPIKSGWAFFPEEIQISRTNNNVLFTGQETEFTFDVVVEVRDGAGAGINNVLVYSGDRQLARTGNDGLATVRALTGPTNLRVERAGWVFTPDSVVATEDTPTVFFTGLREIDFFDVSVRVVDIFGDPVNRVSFSVDGNIVAFTDSDGEVVLRNFSEPKTIVPSKEDWRFDPPSLLVNEDTGFVEFEAIPIAPSFDVLIRAEDEQGQPIPGVSLFIGETVVGITDSQGEAAVVDLKESTVIRPAKSSWTFNPEHFQVTQNTGSFTFTGAKEYQLQVAVLDELGNPIPSTELYLDSILKKATDSDGYALLTGLTGPQELRPQKAGWNFDPVFENVDSTTQLSSFVGTPRPDSFTVTVNVLDGDIGGSGIFGVSVFVDGALAGMTGTDGSVDVRGLLGTPTITVAKDGWQFQPASVQVDKTFMEVNFTPAVQ